MTHAGKMLFIARPWIGTPPGPWAEVGPVRGRDMRSIHGVALLLKPFWLNTSNSIKKLVRFGPRSAASACAGLRWRGGTEGNLWAACPAAAPRANDVSWYQGTEEMGWEVSGGCPRGIGGVGIRTCTEGNLRASRPFPNPLPLGPPVTSGMQERAECSVGSEGNLRDTESATVRHPPPSQAKLCQDPWQRPSTLRQGQFGTGLVQEPSGQVHLCGTLRRLLPGGGQIGYSVLPQGARRGSNSLCQP